MANERKICARPHTFLACLKMSPGQTKPRGQGPEGTQQPYRRWGARRFFASFHWFNKKQPIFVIENETDRQIRVQHGYNSLFVTTTLCWCFRCCYISLYNSNSNNNFLKRNKQQQLFCSFAHLKLTTCSRATGATTN